MPRPVVEEHNRTHLLIKLSTRDSQKVLDLLENPPAPNAKLKAAAKALSIANEAPSWNLTAAE